MRYDLRPLVRGLEYRGAGEFGWVFDAEMQSEPGATGRPDELLAELGFETAARRISRQVLFFADGS